MTDSQAEDAETSVSSETASKDSVEVLGRMYSEYLRVECKPNQVQNFDDSIDELLSRLDEYHGLLDMIRSDSSLCLQKTLPVIHEKGLEMEQIFNKIDQLAEFVAMVKQNLAVLEEQVEAAENEMGSLSAVKKVLGSISLPSFLTSKKPTSPETSPVRTKPSYTPPPIFKTTDYITPRAVTVPGSPAVEALPSISSPSLESPGGSQSGTNILPSGGGSSQSDGSVPASSQSEPELAVEAEPDGEIDSMAGEDGSNSELKKS